MGKLLGGDLTGHVFGRLTVIQRAANDGNHVMWECRCDCGTVKTIRPDGLRNGRVQSCGCLARQKAGERSTKHGMCGSRVYQAWRNMLGRCYIKSYHDWHLYGGRGITVCSRWQRSFENFFADMGEPPEGTSLDRYPNSDGNYEPGNCRWATVKEQNNNLRSNRRIVLNGKTFTLAQLAEEVGLTKRTIQGRLDRGATPEQAVLPRVQYMRQRWGGAA